MKFEEYKRLFDGLNSKRDVEKFAEEGYDPRLLGTLISQKFSRLAMKNNHRIKGKEDALVARWDNGTSFLDIGRRLEYPAFLCMRTILLRKGTDKKTFMAYVNDPELVKNKRMRMEI